MSETLNVRCIFSPYFSDTTRRRFDQTSRSRSRVGRVIDRLTSLFAVISLASRERNATFLETRASPKDSVFTVDILFYDPFYLYGHMVHVYPMIRIGVISDILRYVTIFFKFRGE